LCAVYFACTWEDVDLVTPIAFGQAVTRRVMRERGLVMEVSEALDEVFPPHLDRDAAVPTSDQDEDMARFTDEAIHKLLGWPHGLSEAEERMLRSSPRRRWCNRSCGDL
jgi:hypothetical protein